MTTSTYTPLPTRNEAWGFFGTMQRAGESPETAWDIASRLIAEATEAHDGYGPEGVRDFLDSRDGRHFADMVDSIIHSRARGLKVREGISLRECIAEAIERHQNWMTSRKLEATDGIPRGMPYLTGLVHHHAILAEAEGDDTDLLRLHHGRNE